MIKEGSTVPRKGHNQKREVLADPMYNNVVVTKLINNIMLDGKKGVAQKIVYGAFDRVADKKEEQADKPFKNAPRCYALYKEIGHIGGTPEYLYHIIVSEH